MHVYSPSTARQYLEARTRSASLAPATSQRQNSLQIIVAAGWLATKYLLGGSFKIQVPLPPSQSVDLPSPAALPVGSWQRENRERGSRVERAGGVAESFPWRGGGSRANQQPGQGQQKAQNDGEGSYDKSYKARHLFSATRRCFG